MMTRTTGVAAMRGVSRENEEGGGNNERNILGRDATATAGLAAAAVTEASPPHTTTCTAAGKKPRCVDYPLHTLTRVSRPTADIATAPIGTATAACPDTHALDPDCAPTTAAAADDDDTHTAASAAVAAAETHTAASAGTTSAGAAASSDTATAIAGTHDGAAAGGGGGACEHTVATRACDNRILPVVGLRRLHDVRLVADDDAAATAAAVAVSSRSLLLDDSVSLQRAARSAAHSAARAAARAVARAASSVSNDEYLSVEKHLQQELLCIDFDFSDQSNNPTAAATAEAGGGAAKGGAPAGAAAAVEEGCIMYNDYSSVSLLAAVRAARAAASCVAVTRATQRVIASVPHRGGHHLVSRISPGGSATIISSTITPVATPSTTGPNTSTTTSSTAISSCNSATTTTTVPTTTIGSGSNSSGSAVAIVPSVAATCFSAAGRYRADAATCCRHSNSTSSATVNNIIKSGPISTSTPSPSNSLAVAAAKSNTPTTTTTPTYCPPPLPSAAATAAISSNTLTTTKNTTSGIVNATTTAGRSSTTDAIANTVTTCNTGASLWSSSSSTTTASGGGAADAGASAGGNAAAALSAAAATNRSTQLTAVVGAATTTITSAGGGEGGGGTAATAATEGRPTTSSSITSSTSSTSETTEKTSRNRDGAAATSLTDPITAFVDGQSTFHSPLGASDDGSVRRSRDCSGSSSRSNSSSRNRSRRSSSSSSDSIRCGDDMKQRGTKSHTTNNSNSTTISTSTSPSTSTTSSSGSSNSHRSNTIISTTTTTSTPPPPHTTSGTSSSNTDFIERKLSMRRSTACECKMICVCNSNSGRNKERMNGDESEDGCGVLLLLQRIIEAEQAAAGACTSSTGTRLPLCAARTAAGAAARAIALDRPPPPPAGGGGTAGAGAGAGAGAAIDRPPAAAGATIDKAAGVVSIDEGTLERAAAGAAIDKAAGVVSIDEGTLERAAAGAAVIEGAGGAAGAAGAAGAGAAEAGRRVRPFAAASSKLTAPPSTSAFASFSSAAACAAAPFPPAATNSSSIATRGSSFPSFSTYSTSSSLLCMSSATTRPRFLSMGSHKRPTLRNVSSNSITTTTTPTTNSSSNNSKNNSKSSSSSGKNNKRKYMEKKEQLLRDYTYRISRRVLVDAPERMLLVGTINFLVVLGLSLELSVRCISVACVYVHHFFNVFSFRHLERKLVASAALLLAWKYAEDTEATSRNTRKLYDLSRGIYRVVMQQKAADLRAIRQRLLLLTTQLREKEREEDSSDTSNDVSDISNGCCVARNNNSTKENNNQQQQSGNVFLTASGDTKKSDDGRLSSNSQVLETKEEESAAAVATEESRKRSADGAVSHLEKQNTIAGTETSPCGSRVVPAAGVPAPPTILRLPRFITKNAFSPFHAGPFPPSISTEESHMAKHTSETSPISRAESDIITHRRAMGSPSCEDRNDDSLDDAFSRNSSSSSSFASSPFVPAKTKSGRSVAERAAAAFSLLLADDVIADVVSSSRWLLRDDGASFRSLCQKLRIYEAAVLRAIRFDVCPNFIPLLAIRLYVKLFLVKCCWCLGFSTSEEANTTTTTPTTTSTITTTTTTGTGGKSSYGASDRRKSQSICSSRTCSPTKKADGHCRCIAGVEKEVSPSFTSSRDCCAYLADTKRAISSHCVSAVPKLAQTPVSSPTYQGRNDDDDDAGVHCHQYSTLHTNRHSSPTATDSCCCFSHSFPFSSVCTSDQTEGFATSKCCCSEWPAAGLPYVQLQRRLHAEALQQLLFLCRTPFLIERSPNAIAAACVIKAAIECGLPFIVAAQHQIALATATWRQLRYRQKISSFTQVQQRDKHVVVKGKQQGAKKEQNVEEHDISGAEKKEEKPSLSMLHNIQKRNTTPRRTKSNDVGAIGQRVSIWALETFDRHVTHFIYAINHPYGSYAVGGNGRCSDINSALIAGTSCGCAAEAGHQAKATATVSKSRDVVYSVDAAEVKRVLAELRLATTWMGELLRVSGAEAALLTQRLIKESKDRKKRSRKTDFSDGASPPKKFSVVAAHSITGHAAAPDEKTVAPPMAVSLTVRKASHTAAVCRPSPEAPLAEHGSVQVNDDSISNARTAAVGPSPDALACSVEELLLQETAKSGGTSEPAVQRKRFKKCMEYLRNVMGKRASEDKGHAKAAPP